MAKKVEYEAYVNGKLSTVEVKGEAPTYKIKPK